MAGLGYPQVIGLNGKKSAGKDTVGQMLVDGYGYEQASFARLLKISFAALFGCTVEDLERAKNDPQAQVTLWIPSGHDGEPPLKITLTLREALQRYGTESHRDVFGEDFWVKEATKLDPRKSYVFTDARFPNELKTVQRLGGKTVRIHRHGLDEEDTHESEAEPPFGLIDYHLHNFHDLDALAQRVEEMMGSFDRP